MKRFTPDAIKARMIERLRVSEDWAPILQEGTVGNLIDTIAEGNAELARYEEYLLGEKKWKTAMNFSSLQSQSDLIGYKRRLPQSSIGYIVVSHTDDNGKNRLANYGTYFFDIDAESDFDDLTQKPTNSLEKTKALVPWTNSTPYIIPEGTRFISNKGIEFISTKTIISRVLTKPWSNIKNSNEELNIFKELGGWNGIKYQKVPVIQGIKRSATIGRTSGKRFEAYTYKRADIEAASNNISSKFFKIRLTNKDHEEVWTEIDNIYRASPYDKVFEKKILQDGSGILIKFGDGISGRLPPPGFTVHIDYLETLGKAGNIDAKYQISDIIFPDGSSEVDPRTNTNSKFLNCTNICAIKGGKDIESQEEFKINAPASYLKSYTIGTADLYLDQIMKRSPLSLLHCKVYTDKTITTKDIKGNTPDTVYDFFNIISSNLQVTAVLSNGDILEEDEADEAFIKPLLLSLNGQISPNDTFTYVKPNLIEFAPSLKIRTRSLSLNDDDMRGLISTSLANEYDIFNQEFDEPLYTSKIVELASVFSWVDSVEVINEACAKVSYESTDIKIISAGASNLTQSVESLDDLLVAIPFEFDKIFSKNKYKAGFNNYTVNSDYLLKINVNFKNGSNTIKDRTFFLFDNRVEDTETDEDTARWIEDAKTLYIDSPNEVKVAWSTDIGDFKNVNFINENENLASTAYEKRQARVAQFEYIGSVTDNKTMALAKTKGVAPFEIRPVIQDKNGSKLFTGIDTPEELRQEIIAGAGVDSNGKYYKKDTRFINNINICFRENYYDIDSKNSGNGYFIAPLSFFGFDPQALDIKENQTENFKKIVEILLKEYVDIHVMAQPKSEVFEPDQPNDICFIDKKNIKVDKEIIY